MATVGGAEDAAFSVGAVGMTFDGNEEPFGIIGIDDDVGDLLGVVEADARPGFAAVSRAVQAVADGKIGALQTLAAADVDGVGIGGCDGDGADGARGLIVEDGIPGVAEVVRSPDAAIDLSHVKDAGLLRDAGDGDGASAAEGADAAPAEFGVDRGIVLRSWRGLCGSVLRHDGEEHRGCKQD